MMIRKDVCLVGINWLIFITITKLIVVALKWDGKVFIVFVIYYNFSSSSLSYHRKWLRKRERVIVTTLLSI